MVYSTDFIVFISPARREQQAFLYVFIYTEMSKCSPMDLASLPSTIQYILSLWRKGYVKEIEITTQCLYTPETHCQERVSRPGRTDQSDKNAIVAIIS